MFLDFVLGISGTIYRNIWWLQIRSISSKTVLTSTALICVSVLISRTCSRREEMMMMCLWRTLDRLPAYGRLKMMMIIRLSKKRKESLLFWSGDAQQQHEYTDSAVISFDKHGPIMWMTNWTWYSHATSAHIPGLLKHQHHGGAIFV